MKTICQMCGEHVVNPKPVDVPSGAVLCCDCYDECVWTCNSCGHHVARPDIEGGELEGDTPLITEHWCQTCCDEKVGTCTECGSEDLVEDMNSTDDGLLCEQCAAGYGPSVAEDSPLLTKENWREAVVAAVSGLPDDIQQSVGYHELSDDCLVIRVACEPMPGESGESTVNEINVRWWNTRREQLESYIQESPGMGLERYLESEGPMIDRPSISIEPGGATGPTSGPVPGKANVIMMKGMIQEAILNELFEGGGISMVFKDNKGRFIREDGTYIFDWQRPPGG